MEFALEKLCDLLFELSSEARLKILYELQKEDLKLSHISNRIDISVQETSRNIARLVEAKLVNRTTDGSYAISPYGNQIIRYVAGYRFLSKQSDYFYTHSLDNLPQKLFSRIGELNHCRPVTQLLDVFANIEKVFKEAEEYFMYMGEPLGVASTFSFVVEALDRGVVGRSIEPVGYDWPDEIRESIPKEIWDSFSKHFFNKTFQRRYLDKFDVTFLINEKEVAILNFINPTNEFEYMGFTSIDEQAVEWCKDVFEYYWKKVE